MAHLCSGDLLPDDFLSLIENHPWPENSLLMAFTPIECRFEKYVFDSQFLSQSDQGRVFSPEGELCWRWVEKNMRVVYLGESPPQQLTDFSSKLAGLSPSTRQLFLWGERTETENEWIEQQVPHRFMYPIDTVQFPKGRAALVVEDWKDTAGIPRFSRYHSLIEVKGEK